MTRTPGATLLVIVSLGTTAFGCAHVAPSERGRLAHRTMAPDHGASLAVEHLQTLHEGATGGTAETSSGCGCN